MKKLVLSLILFALPSAAYAAPTYGPLYDSGSVAVRYGSVTLTEPSDLPRTSYGAFATMAPGMAETRIVITGYDFRFLTTVNPLRQFALDTSILRYNAATGEVLWQVETVAETETGAGKAFSIELRFAILQADGVNAHLSDIDASCSSSGGTCEANSTAFGASPAGMVFSDFALGSFALQTQAPDGAGIPIQTMGVGINSRGVIFPTTDVGGYLLCAFSDAVGDKGIACAARSVGLASAATETNVQRVFHFDAATAPVSIASNLPAPLDIDGSTLAMRSFLMGFTSADHDLWRWEAGGKDVSVTFGVVDHLLYTRTGFLGTTLNSTSTASFEVATGFNGYGLLP